MVWKNQKAKNTHILQPSDPIPENLSYGNNIRNSSKVSTCSVHCYFKGKINTSTCLLNYSIFTIRHYIAIKIIESCVFLYLISKRLFEGAVYICSPLVLPGVLPHLSCELHVHRSPIIS